MRLARYCPFPFPFPFLIRGSPPSLRAANPIMDGVPVFPVIIGQQPKAAGARGALPVCHAPRLNSPQIISSPTADISN
jgi:hypothetical protein